MAGFHAEKPTFYCGNVHENGLVQVIDSGVRLIDCETFQLLDEYVAECSVTVATGNSSQVVIALSGGLLVCLDIDAQARTIREKARVLMDQEIACVSIDSVRVATPPTSDAMDIDTMDVDDHNLSNTDATGGASASTETHLMLAVGLWTDHSVRLLASDQNTLQEISQVRLGSDVQARDILIVVLQGTTYLMIGLGDGSIVTYMVAYADGMPTLSNRRKGVLGTTPISFSQFHNSGDVCVFASCDRPTVIYALNHKLLFSVVNLSQKGVTCMSSFHSELFPDCLAIASEETLMLGVIEDIQKIHVQSIPMHESPRRIEHSAP